MTICHIPCAVNTPVKHISSPANTKADFQVLEFTLSARTLFKTKILWKLRLQIEMPLYPMKAAATVNFPHF